MRSQTATEYLVITAVVIIIAIIVVSALGGIPSIGESTNEAVTRAKLSSARIGITDYALTCLGTHLTVSNNGKSRILVNNVSINDNICHFLRGGR